MARYEHRPEAPTYRTRAPQLNAEWGVGAVQAKYSDDGDWYDPFDRFPAALFDRNGYLRFATEAEYRAAPIRIGKKVGVPKPGISALPGYIRMTGGTLILPIANAELVEAEVSATEGRELLRLHRERERDRGLIAHKKRQARSGPCGLACEACGFDFATEYGELGVGFAECHHRQPLADTGETRTTLADLALVCANCHRMLHRRPWRRVEELGDLVRSRRSSEPRSGGSW